MIELRRTAISIAAHVFQRARLDSDCRENIESSMSTALRKTSGRAVGNSVRDAPGH